ncbi:hypothetical protein [Aeribacillus composti]|jgi:putative transposase|uniref:hypothetical protein n=1 Tax=Aeribacillus composti TaxID=1868734 RepID=UPI00399C8F92
MAQNHITGNDELLHGAWLLLEQVLAKWEEKVPKAMQILEEGFEDATAALD